MTADQKAGAFVFAAKGAPEKRDGSDDDDDDDKPDAKVDNKAQPGKATEAKSPDTTSSDAKSDKPDDDDDAPKTLEQRYEARYPQDVRVSDLVGKPLLETNNVSIGRIESVAKTSDGRFLLIVPYGGFLGHGQPSRRGAPRGGGLDRHRADLGGSGPGGLRQIAGLAEGDGDDPARRGSDPGRDHATLNGRGPRPRRDPDSL